jgi:trans-2,3-dihydro-3-hydroxyanthranilate isomerase
MEVPFAGYPTIGTATVALLAAARGAYKGTIHRGEDMGRPSRIGVDAVPDRVTVSGQAVRVMEGQLP